MPIAAGAIALASLVLTALTASSNWLRQRRQSTIEAWIGWSNGTVDARKMLSRRLGIGKISNAQAEALVDRNKPLPDLNGKDLTVDEKAEIGNCMVLVLNGLERLSVGAQSGVYDHRVLRDLGATIIVRWYEMFLPYIEERRSTKDEDLRQRRVYVALDAEVASLRAHKQQLDQERLRRLAS